MKKYNLLDVLNKIDDKYIEKSIKIDTAKKLKNEKKPTNNFFKWCSLCLGCICLILSVALINKNEIPSSILTQGTLSSNELDINTFISFKNVETYTVSFENNKIKDAKIIYQDKSEIKISKEDTNPNEKEETINGTTVKHYTINNTNYASWYKNGYYHVYSSYKKITKNELELLIN